MLSSGGEDVVMLLVPISEWQCSEAGRTYGP